MIFIIRTLAFLLLITSCTFNDLENYNIAKTFIFGGEKFQVTKNLYDQQQFSFAKASIGRGQEVILSLKSINNEVFEWISEDGILIYTYHGVIIRTEGLESNINHRDFSMFNSLRSFSTFVDFFQPDLFEIETDYIFINKDFIFYEYLGSLNQFESYMFIKKIDLLDWETQLNVVKDAKGRIIYSRQEIHPHLRAFKMEFYYK